jgi:hypothetical protein
VSLLDEVAPDTTLLEGVLLVGLAVATDVVVTGVVVTALAELGEVLADGLVAALEAADPVAEALVPPLAEDTAEGNAWASWVSAEEMALAGLAAAPSPAAPTELPVEVGRALAACCRATDSASNRPERNCVSA